MIPYSSRWNLLCMTVSQIKILFFARQSPVWSSSKALSRGNTASNSTEGANLLFSPSALCLRLEFPTGAEMSSAHFLSFCRGQTGGTPVGFTLLLSYSTLPLSLPLHPYLAKVKEIFAGTPLSRFLLPAVVSCPEPNCHSEIESMDILGRSITAFMLLHASTLPTVSKMSEQGVSE